MYTILGVIAKPLGMLLNLLYGFVQNYGLTIIIFTLIVKLCLYPLYIKQTKSTARMAEVQPKMQALQNKYANDKETLNIKMAELYKEEKLYDRLLAYVLKSSGLYAVQSYENVLKKEYPKQILSKYQDEVNKMASCTGNRKHYADLVALLRRMKQIKGGSEIVETIVEEWKIKYRNRPAMMDELSKL